MTNLPMNENQKELTLEESVKQVMQILPPPIQRYLGHGKNSEIAKELAEKYVFDTDQTTILEREMMLLLMGIENPDEFADALNEQLPISEQIVQDILADINKEVFIPMQEEMKKATGKITPPAKPVESTKPVTSFTPPREENPTFNRPTPANPVLPKHPDIQPAGMEWIKAPQPPHTAPVIAQIPNYSPQQPSHFHLENKKSPLSLEAIEDAVKAIKNEKLLEDREESHIYMDELVPVIPAKTAPPPSNLPGVIQPPIIPEVKKPIPPATPISVASARPYSIDPYHEPIE